MSEGPFEATTIEDALQLAATRMGVDPADLDYEVVEEKKDFWGLGDGTVVINAWRRAAAPTEAPARERPEPEALAVSRDERPPEEEERDERPEAGAATAPEGGAGAAEDDDEYRDEAGDDDEYADEDEDADEDEGEDESDFWEAGEAGEEPAREREAPSPGPPGREEPTERREPGQRQEQQDTAWRPEAEEAARRSDEEETDGGAGGNGDVEAADVSALLEQIFHDMAFDCTVEVEAADDGFDVTVAGADKELLLEGNGRALSAVELILNNAFRHRLGQGSKVRVDAGDFRSRREDELADLAYQVAHAAKESGETQETQPLNPYERRLVHLALADDPAVTTRSRGSGFLKNVQIIPRGSGGGGRR